SADTFAVIIDLSGRLIAAGRVVGDAHSVATLVWSIVHGFADLSRSGAVEEGAMDDEVAREQAFLAQVRALFARDVGAAADRRRERTAAQRSSRVR
ncbi:MAG: hypothetical protein ACRCYQ_16100, partial [Nocardioides sp.]